MVLRVRFDNAKEEALESRTHHVGSLPLEVLFAQGQQLSTVILC
jgi:hypothetical protein